jgi:nucleoid-associated protein YgaU
VAEGESLASVAKKVYGPEEGNRLVNVQRIYEANRDVLKSPDEVIAGQKLVIPPLPRSGSGPKKPEEVLSAALFKFQSESGAKPAPAAAPSPKQEGRWYVVQDGDNLWKIAVNQLGSGARYEEIVKLNALKDKDSLDVGMRLRLPAK